MKTKYNSILPKTKSKDEIYKLYQFELRSHLLELAAVLDRIERAEGDFSYQSEIDSVLAACQVLHEKHLTRTEKIQLLLSDD